MVKNIKGLFGVVLPASFFVGLPVFRAWLVVGAIRTGVVREGVGLCSRRQPNLILDYDHGLRCPRIMDLPLRRSDWKDVLRSGLIGSDQVHAIALTNIEAGRHL